MTTTYVFTHTHFCGDLKSVEVRAEEKKGSLHLYLGSADRHSLTFTGTGVEVLALLDRARAAVVASLPEPAAVESLHDYATRASHFTPLEEVA